MPLKKIFNLLFIIIPSLSGVLAQNIDSIIKSSTLRVQALECIGENGPENRVLSGFIIKNSHFNGAITALHGVCGCKAILVENDFGVSAKVDITLANVEKDIAILNSDEFQAKLKFGLDIYEFPSGDTVDGNHIDVYGYEQGSFSLRPSPNNLLKTKSLEVLGSNIGNKVANTLNKRGSPSISEKVIFYQGSPGPGTSGGPVLLNNKVIAVNNGGLIFSGTVTSWGIPLKEIESWHFITKKELESLDDYEKLSSNKQTEQFSSHPVYESSPTKPFMGDSDKLRVYILPFSNTGDFQLESIEKSLSTVLKKEFISKGVLVKYESNNKNLPSTSGIASEYAKALNADVVIYGKYAQNMYEKGRLTLNFLWKEKIHTNKYGMDDFEFKGEITVDCENNISDISKGKSSIDIQNIIIFFEAVHAYFNKDDSLALKKLDLINKYGSPNANFHFLRNLAYKMQVEKLNNSLDPDSLFSKSYRKSIFKRRNQIKNLRISSLNKAIKTDSLNWNSYWALSELYRLDDWHEENDGLRLNLLKTMKDLFPEKRQLIYFEMAQIMGANLIIAGHMYSPIVNYDLAVKYCKEVLNINPNFFLAKRALADLYWYGEDREFVKALKEINEAYCIEPPYFNSKVRIPLLDEKEFHFEFLEQFIFNSIDINSKRKRFKPGMKPKKLGEIDTRMNDTAYASAFIGILEKILKKSNDNNVKGIIENNTAYSTFLIGIALRFTYRPTILHLLLNKAEEVESSNLLVYLVRARAYEVLDKDYQKGLSQLERCLNLQKDNGMLYSILVTYIIIHDLENSSFSEYREKSRIYKKISRYR